MARALTAALVAAAWGAPASIVRAAPAAAPASTVTAPAAPASVAQGPEPETPAAPPSHSAPARRVPETAAPEAGLPAVVAPAKPRAVSVPRSGAPGVAPAAGGTRASGQVDSNLGDRTPVAPVQPPRAAESAAAVEGGGRSSADGSAPLVPTLEPEYRLRMRLMTGYEYGDERSVGASGARYSDDFGFFLRQARVDLRARLQKRLRLEVSVEFADAIDPGGTQPNDPPYLRDAALEVRILRGLRVLLGRFKRPFSSLELRGAGSLPIRGRGLLNGLVTEDNQWGDRATGMMLFGKFKSPKLRWALGVHNPDWSASLPARGVDVIGRVTVKLAPWLRAGLNGGHKYVELGNDKVHANAFGGDVRLQLGSFDVQLEATVADLPWDDHQGLGALSLVTYDVPLTSEWTLQPVGFIEYADADSEYDQNESMRLVGGVNLLGYGQQLRIMPQVQLTQPVGDAIEFAQATDPRATGVNPWLEEKKVYLMVSLQL